MVQEQLVSMDPDDMMTSTVIGAGRYVVTSAEFVDDFDYGGSQKKGTAAYLHFTDPDGKTYDQHFGVGDKTRIWPSKDGQGLVGGQLSDNSGWARVIKFATQIAGLPKTKLWASQGVPAPINTIFAGLWCDWISHVPDGQPKTKKNSKTGQEEENRGQIIPNKFYMDGDTAAPVPTAPANVQAAAPPAPPAPVATPPPPAPVATPPPPPAPAVATNVAPAPSPNGVGIEARFPAMLVIAQAMVANASTPNTRAQLAAEVFMNLDVSDVPEMQQHEIRVEAITAVHGDFTTFLGANGMKVEAEEVSVA